MVTTPGELGESGGPGELAADPPCRIPVGHPLRAEVLARHARAVEAGLSTYPDPITGYTVLTASYLRDRGYCCNSGCRHCPY